VGKRLALLPATGLPAQALRNLFLAAKAERFEEPLNNQMMLVCRLDAPEPALVRAMIDNALTAETIRAFMGAAYFDAQGSASRATKRG